MLKCWRLIVLCLTGWGLAGCTNLNSQLSNLLTVLVAGSCLLAVVGAIVTMKTNDSERRVAAGLIAFTALVAGVLFVVMLAA